MKSLFAGALLGAMAAIPANAAVVIDVTETLGGVVFTTSGSLNLTGASQGQTNPTFGLGVISGGDNWYIGTGTDIGGGIGGAYEGYVLSSFDGAFGTNTSFITSPTSATGDTFFLWGNFGDVAQIGVTAGYVSGTAINSVMTFGGTDFVTMGLTAGVYNYALPNDTITLNIGDVAAPIPLPAGLPLILAGLGALGFVGRKGRKARTDPPQDQS